MPDLNPTNPEILVNTATAGDQTATSLSALANGVQVATWLDAGSSVAKFRLLSADGRPISGELALGPATHVEATPLRDGGFAVSWIERSGDISNVHARAFDAAGAATGPDILIATYSSSLARSYEALGVHAEALTNGGFAVTWATESHDSFFIRSVSRNLAVVDVAGSIVAQSAAGLNTPSKALSIYDPGVRAVELADGGLLVTWWVKPTSSEFGGQRVQRYDLNGQPVTAAAQLDRLIPLDGGARAEGANLDAAVLADGRIVFAWNSGENVVYSIYSSAGLGEHPVDDRTAPQIAGAGVGAPHIAVLADGRFAIAWTSASGAEADAVARLFGATGTADGAVFRLGDTADGAQDLAAVAAISGGGLVAAWNGADESGVGVRLQVFAPATPSGPAVHVGGATDETLVGGPGEDWLYAQGGADTLTGHFGADVFIFSERGGADRVLDFVRGEDHLQLFNAAGGFADGSRGLLIFDPNTHQLSWDPDSDSGAAAAQVIATLDGVSQLARSDVAAGFQPSALRTLYAWGKEETVFDWGAATWDQTVSQFNAAGAAFLYQVFNDDRSSSSTWFDDSGTQAWSTRWASYDATSAMTAYQVTLDDGRHTVWTFDPHNRETWSRSVDEYDAQGRLLTRAWSYDDGQGKSATFDVDGRQPWSMQVEVFAATGARTALWTYMDDGSFVG